MTFSLTHLDIQLAAILPAEIPAAVKPVPATLGHREFGEFGMKMKTKTPVINIILIYHSNEIATKYKLIICKGPLVSKGQVLIEKKICD